VVVDVAVATSVVEGSLAAVPVVMSVAEELLEGAIVELVEKSLVEVVTDAAAVPSVVSVDVLAPELPVAMVALAPVAPVGLKKHAVVSKHAPSPSTYLFVMPVFIRIDAPRSGQPWSC
jgi:hypothetical protein